MRRCRVNVNCAALSTKSELAKIFNNGLELVSIIRCQGSVIYAEVDLVASLKPD